MSVQGEFHIESKYGTLIANAEGRYGNFLLRNERGVVKLCSKKETFNKQLRLPFEHFVKFELFEELLQHNAQRIMHLAEDFPGHQREILAFCINGGRPALELVKNCPALAYLIAWKLLPKISPEILPEKLQDLLAQKRRAILAVINWPSAEWIIKVLRKIPASQCSADMLEKLETLMMSEDSNKIKVLRHVQILYRYTITLLADKELSPYVAYSFYEATGMMPRYSILPPGIEVFELKNELLSAISNGFHLSPLKSLYDLKSLHMRFINWLTTIDNYEEIKELSFPSPPCLKKIIKIEAGEEFGIFPLENGDALWREGVEMNNCIAGYSRQIIDAKGSMYVYHVKLPDSPPATLMIRSFGLSWYISEIRAKNNEEVPPHVKHWVKRWLASQNTDPQTEIESGASES